MPIPTLVGTKPSVNKDKRELVFGDIHLIERNTPAIPGLETLHGRILEVGFGTGMAHRTLHDDPNITEIVIIELYPEVIEAFKDCSCEVLHVDATQDLPDDLGSFNGILLDVWPAHVDPTPYRFLVARGGTLIQREADERGTPTTTSWNRGNT